MLAFATVLLLPFQLQAELSASEAEKVVANLKAKLIQTVNSKNASDMAIFYEKDAIMVLGTSRLIRGQDNIRAFMKAPFLEEDVKISHFVIDKVDFDPPAVIIDNNTFIATGTAQYKIIFNKAKQITLPNRWIAVFHREEGKWHIASYQGTVNTFDNPYIEDMRNIFYLISLVTFLLGIIVTVAWRRIKKSKTS